MNELILINKDKDFTSRDVINILSKIFNTKKIGHFGTLDPLATGLLVVGIGKYTKSEVLFKTDKEYEVEILLGIKTDTYDITGTIIEKKDIKSFDYNHIINIINSFVGEYLQEVPIYSAVKVKGKKLYEYARNNIEVNLPKKVVKIYYIDKIKFYKKNNREYISFITKVSKGTYIRSLVNDISNKLNIPLCMSNLKRTKIDKFCITEAYSIEDIKNNNYKFVDIDKYLNYKKIEIPESMEKLIFNGNKIKNIYDNDKIIFTKNKKNIVLYISNFDSEMKPVFFF